MGCRARAPWPRLHAALPRAEAQRRAEEERAHAARDAFISRLNQEAEAINAEVDVVVRAFKMYEWKLRLIKKETQALLDANLQWDISQLPWPIFKPHSAPALLKQNDDEPVYIWRSRN